MNNIDEPQFEKVVGWHADRIGPNVFCIIFVDDMAEAGERFSAFYPFVDGLAFIQRGTGKRLL